MVLSGSCSKLWGPDAMTNFLPSFNKIYFPPSKAIPKQSEEQERLEDRLERESSRLMRLKGKLRRAHMAVSRMERQVERTRMELEAFS